MKSKKITNEALDIPIAKRKYLENNNSKFYKKILLLSPVFLIAVSLIGLRAVNYLKLISITDQNNQINNIRDKRILGHLPYEEVSNEKLVKINPYLKVHVDMHDSLLKMREVAKLDGVHLVFLSGYRSKNLQREIFYSLKAARNQVASERARVSAPPGYSEHSTGFAIDIGDATNRKTDFEVEFENTAAFRWLKMNAAKYHFKLSFDKNNKYVDYEPWHWRFEGSIEALKVFENANRNL